MKMLRTTAVVGGLAIAGLLLVGCGSGSSHGSATTTSSSTSTPVTSSVLPPVIITPQMADEGGTTPVPAIHVGDSVVFSMGAIEQGVNVVARSKDPTRFLVTSKGTNNGTVTINAGGRAVSVGTVKVSVGATGPNVENFLGTFTLVIS